MLLFRTYYYYILLFEGRNGHNTDLGQYFRASMAAQCMSLQQALHWPKQYLFDGSVRKSTKQCSPGWKCGTA